VVTPAGKTGFVAADALSPLGISHIDMPATPEKVWQAIRMAQAG